jgi:hypothetical protein
MPTNEPMPDINKIMPDSLEGFEEACATKWVFCGVSIKLRKLTVGDETVWMDEEYFQTFFSDGLPILYKGSAFIRKDMRAFVLECINKEI